MDLLHSHHKINTKKENDGKMTAVLGNRTTAVHVPLEDGILVRIQVPQLDPLEIAGFCFKFDNAPIRFGDCRIIKESKLP